jgi:hypothetical protein
MCALMSNWKIKFSQPIATKAGAPMTTLEDARTFLVDMDWREVRLPHWRDAMEAVLAAAKDGDLTRAEAALSSAMTIANEAAVPAHEPHHLSKI